MPLTTVGVALTGAGVLNTQSCFRFATFAVVMVISDGLARDCVMSWPYMGHSAAMAMDESNAPASANTIPRKRMMDLSPLKASRKHRTHEAVPQRRRTLSVFGEFPS